MVLQRYTISFFCLPGSILLVLSTRPAKQTRIVHTRIKHHVCVCTLRPQKFISSPLLKLSGFITKGVVYPKTQYSNSTFFQMQFRFREIIKRLYYSISIFFFSLSIITFATFCPCRTAPSIYPFPIPVHQSAPANQTFFDFSPILFVPPEYAFQKGTVL